MSSPYAAAPADKLAEIIREAEARLAAQLTLGVAADQRAMTLASFLATLDAAVIALWTTHGIGHPWPLGMLTVGLAFAALLAVASARPVAWELPGNMPSAWLDDIAEGDSLHNGIAAMAGFYDDMLDTNARTLADNGWWLRRALAVMIVTLMASAVAAFFAN